MAGLRSRTTLAVLAVTVLTFVFFTHHYRSGNTSAYLPNQGSTGSSAAIAQSKFNLATLELREGITIFGDSYSVDTVNHWTNHIAKNISQIFSIQGASLDNKLSHDSQLSNEEFADLAEDLTAQVAMMTTYCTETVIIWFGINDLMTLHHWEASRRHDAIEAEHAVLSSFVDALIELGVQRIIIPKTIDFSPSPGLSLARDANQMVSAETTRSAIEEWNKSLDRHVISRLPQVETIDFYRISQDWYARFDHYGLRSLLNVEEVKTYGNYMWADFLHLTPFVHRTMIAPHFDTALS